VDYLVTESVYGNRTHEEALRAEKTLVDAVMLAEKRRGTLLIPAFSLERTHIILSMLDALIARGAVPRLPVFMDSPLASKVTEVYRQHPSFMRAEMRSHMEKGDDPFSFPGLSVTTESEDSEGIHAVPSPKIIIAGSGMSHGGRIRAHELKYLPDPSSVILMVGYQSPGSLGRRIRDGASAVTIDGKKVNVRARVLTTGGFSAHADRDDLLNYAAEVSPKTAFVVLGEMASASFLAQRLSGFFGIKTVIPQEGETYELESEES
jgi:metallo-beta-lactamase family protein